MATAAPHSERTKPQMTGLIRLIKVESAIIASDPRYRSMELVGLDVASVSAVPKPHLLIHLMNLRLSPKSKRS